MTKASDGAKTWRVAARNLAGRGTNLATRGDVGQVTRGFAVMSFVSLRLLHERLSTRPRERRDTVRANARSDEDRPC